MGINDVVENSYQGGEEKKLTRAELERLESTYGKQATDYASEGMYSNAAGCKTKAQLVHDLLISYKWEEDDEEQGLGVVLDDEKKTRRNNV